MPERDPFLDWCSDPSCSLCDGPAQRAYVEKPSEGIKRGKNMMAAMEELRKSLEKTFMERSQIARVRDALIVDYPEDFEPDGQLPLD